VDVDAGFVHGSIMKAVPALRVKINKIATDNSDENKKYIVVAT